MPDFGPSSSSTTSLKLPDFGPDSCQIKFDKPIGFNVLNDEQIDEDQYNYVSHKNTKESFLDKER